MDVIISPLPRAVMDYIVAFDLAAVRRYATAPTGRNVRPMSAYPAQGWIDDCSPTNPHGPCPDKRTEPEGSGSAHCPDPPRRPE
jgi:hypothetical protein